MNSKNIFKERKDFLLKNHLNVEELQTIKPTKFLFLIKDEIEALLKFYSKKEIHVIINSVFENGISLSLFYMFCNKNITTNLNKTTSSLKDKINHKESQNIVNNIDDLTSNTLDFLSKNLPKK